MRKKLDLFSQRGQAGVAYGCGALVAVAVVFGLLILFSGANVAPGHVGVVSTTSDGINVKQQPLGQGFHLVMPFTTHIESVSIQPQNHTFREVGTASKELQNVFVDGGVNYHIDALAAAQLTVNGGSEAIVTKVFDPAFQDYIKEIVPTYPTEQILPNRSTIRDEVKSRLAEKAVTYGITVDDVFITNIHFDKSYTDAIEAKQVASQKLEQAKVEALTAATQAEGTANAQIAQAKGDAEANRLRSQYLSSALIYYLEIQKWNGQLPQATGGNAFVSLSPPNSGR